MPESPPTVVPPKFKRFSSVVSPIRRRQGQACAGGGTGSTGTGAEGDPQASVCAEIVVHGSAQDQLAQIMKGGKLVVFGDVGQTFGYAAKGGHAYVLGNAAGRPRIEAGGECRNDLQPALLHGRDHAVVMGAVARQNIRAHHQ